MMALPVEVQHGTFSPCQPILRGSNGPSHSIDPRFCIENFEQHRRVDDITLPSSKSRVRWMDSIVMVNRFRIANG